MLLDVNGPLLQVKKTIYIAALILTCGLLSEAAAQSTFIVRLEATAASDLVEALEQGIASKQGPYAALFDQVTAVQPVVRESKAGKNAALPFRAYTLSTPDSVQMARLLAAWAAQPGVAYTQRNHLYRLDGFERLGVYESRSLGYLDSQAHRLLDSSSQQLDSLAHLSVIRALEAWEITTGSADVRIGLVDTGLFFEHPDFVGQIWINPGEDLNGNGWLDPSDFNGIDDDGNGFVDDLRGYDFVDRTTNVEQGDYQQRDPDPSEDDQMGSGRGHGTLVAGVLAANLDNGEGAAGVAPGSRLVSLRAFGADGTGEDDDIAAAIVYAAQQGLDVLNLSFGDVYYSPLMHEAIQFAVSQGTVVVASAGNLGGDDPHYPSDYPEVISTAWFLEDGSGIAGRATYGIGIDLGAPGSFVYTTLMPRTDEKGDFDPDGFYGRRSGSSVAAPMVAGAAALLRSVDPTLLPAAIQSILTGSARDLNEPGWDHRTGAGLLDVATALARSLPARVAIDRPEHDAGWAGNPLAITGSVVDPAFVSYAVYYAEGDEDLGAAWQQIAGPMETQKLRDTLAVWQAGALPDGIYTLRLAATLRTGGTIEDRRRVFLDRTPPEITPRIFNTGLDGGAHGIVADVATDDLTDMRMKVEIGSETHIVEGERRARVHGLTWSDASGRGGLAQVHIIATNRAGLESELTATFEVPRREVNTALFSETTLTTPHGYLLPRATDFDQDNLLEITLNRYEDGWIGDTLATYEWDGADFRPAQKLIANVIPRDVGDTDGDGFLELLTQVAAATLLLEQETTTGYPSDISFVDTTGLSDPFADNAAFGALLPDLDADGNGEILVHNTKQWRVLEYDDGEYTEVFRLDNPTAAANTEITQNEFQQPLAVVDDLDGDGRLDLLTGDGDGDWIIYETTGNNTMAAVWTYETPRYNAGARFGSGDFDGDGVTEFVTYTQNWTQPTGAGEREPDIGLYYFWDAVGDDRYVLVDSLPIPGLLSRHGSMIAADFDSDGRDELVLVNAPDLYVFSFDATLRRTLRYHRGSLLGLEANGMRSVALVADDFDGDGTPDLIAAGANEKLHRFVFDAAAAVHPPPVWEQAFALDAQTVLLSWHAADADSVAVYMGASGEPLDLIATGGSIDSLRYQQDAAARFALRGWYGDTMSPLSEARTVRPHAPAVVLDVAYPAARTVELLFSEPLHPEVLPDQFSLEGTSPEAVLLARDNQSVVLRFEEETVAQGLLRWEDVEDAEGTPVWQYEVAVSFSTTSEGTLFIVQSSIPASNSVLLTFNKPVDPAFATDVSNYTLKPSGTVVAASLNPERPTEVLVTVEGRAIGATGLETSLVVRRMRGAAGEELASEGTAVLLTATAENLDDVYVFPNPFRADQHQPRVIIAGLPEAAMVSIFSVQGVPVRQLEETDGNGGLTWDLLDAQGQAVPSGMYLVRVEAPDEQAILIKAAIIR